MGVLELLTWVLSVLLGAVTVMGGVYVVALYAAWWVVRSRSSLKHRAHPIRALVLEWLAAAVILLLAIPTVFRRVVRLSAGTPGGVPVLCVPGYTQNWGNFVVMARSLAGQGTGPVYGMNVVPRFASMEETAPQVTQALRRVMVETGAAQVDVVCHSMGGLVARVAMARHGAGGLVRRLVTVGTPHQGTVIAAYGAGRNAVEMRRRSAFLAALPPPPPALLSVWSTADAVVLPSESASFVGREVVFDSLGHLSMLFSPGVWSAVAHTLTAPEPAPHVTPATAPLG